MNLDIQYTAIVRKSSAAGTAIITVGLKISSGPFGIESKFEQPVVLEPTEESRKIHATNEQLFKACEGAATSGVFYATQGDREKCGSIVFTIFNGTTLPPDCGIGFAIAAAIACLEALDLNERVKQMDMQGWESI